MPTSTTRRLRTHRCCTCPACRSVGWSIITKANSIEVAWVAPERLDSLNMHPSMRLRIDHYLERRNAPSIG